MLEYEDKMFRVNAIDFFCSICDGPGLRTVIYFQGCTRCCTGCHNPQTWNKLGGVEASVSNIADKIFRFSKTKRVTISGGEPLLQKDALLLLLELLEREGFDVALYTGYGIDDVPANIKEKINYLKTGEYCSDLRTTTEPYIGSTNQKFHDLRKVL